MRAPSYRRDSHRVLRAPGLAIFMATIALLGCTSSSTRTVDTAVELRPTPPPSPVTSPSDPTTDVESTAAGCDCYDLTDVGIGGDGRVMFTIFDRRERNATLVEGNPHPSPTLQPRPIYVAGFIPSSGDATGLIVHGVYRNGTQPNEVTVPRPGSTIAEFWVGFPMMDEHAPQMADIPNHPGDISLLLDVLEENPDTFGEIDTSSTVYMGGSMGAISGLLFANTCCRDPRVAAVVATAGYPPDASTGWLVPYDFDLGPEILSVVGVDDATIPYSFSSRLIGVSDRVTVLSIPSGSHAGLFGSCPAANEFIGAFVGHFLFGAPRPVWNDPCASTDLLPGGVAGAGAITPFLV